MGIARIRHQEPARVDSDRLETLLCDLGAAGAERFLCRTLEDIAVRLNRTERAWQNDDIVRVCHGSRELSEVARGIGLTSLAGVARSVSETAAVGDAPALAALVARMTRVGEASLLTVWNVQDQTV